jgi:hypothetical protein
VVTDRLVNRIDWLPTRINSLTASTPAAIRTPVHFPTDRECLEQFFPTVGKFDFSQVTIGWIRNTMELTPILLSENLRGQIDQNPILEIAGPARDMEFDSQGNLADMLAGVGELAPAH